MANGFGTLYIGVSGLQSSQNALNTTANNLANVDTLGYVRQQVLFADRNYVTFNETASISKQQSGLGVKIGDVLHTRDIFLDRSYRTENGRKGFYGATYETAYEVETYYQELEGVAFQDALEDFWVSFEEFAKGPDDSINQNLVVQKAQLFLSRASEVYSGLQSFQYNINTQITDDINRINELGKSIHEMNLAVQKVEAGDIETAMTIRDARDLALDELSGLVDISYTEDVNGVVRVSIEGVEFVDEVHCYEMGMKTDKVTGFVTPYWPHLSDTNRGKYVNVFDFGNDISADNKNDMGSLKALILARGDHIANYTDVKGMDKNTFNDSTGMSVMLKAEAELDQMIHGIVTALNDLFAPNIEAKDLIGELTGGAGTTLDVVLEDGTVVTLDENTKILDAENCPVGADKKLPPQEMFSRIGTERYTKATYTYQATDENGDPAVDQNGDPVMVTKEIYIYNEEDPKDTTKQYTLQSLSVNEALILDEASMPHLMQNDTPAWELAKALEAVWDSEDMFLNPNDNKKYSFKEYYQAMAGEAGTFANVYEAATANLTGTVAAIDNQRQQVIGVSSDEELTYMIKYQNAYNASSRFINVVDEMIEHLLTQLG